MDLFRLPAVGAPRIPMGNHMAALHQAGVVECVGVQAPLHHVLQPLEPGGLAEGAQVLNLWVGAFLQHVVEAILLLLIAREGDCRRLG